MIGVEHRYNPLKKVSSFSLCHSKMWYYLIGQLIDVISRVNPLRLVMTKLSSLNCWLAKWAILLSQYEMWFIP